MPRQFALARAVVKRLTPRGTAGDFQCHCATAPSGHLQSYYRWRYCSHRRCGTALRCCIGTAAAIWRAGTKARWRRAAPWSTASCLRRAGRSGSGRCCCGKRPLLLLGIIAALSVATTLPWLTAILLTDIFAGLGVLALYLLLLRNEALGGAERIGLIALIALSAATHNATLAVLLGLLAAAAVLWLIDRRRLPRVRLE